MEFARRKDELEDFKSQINLCEYMASYGFVLDRKQSSRSSAIMRHSNGDKLIVARGANRHWKYFNVHDDRDKGTIIDFAQLRDRGTLGEVRKKLRPWIGRGGTIATSSTQHIVALEPCEHEVARVLLSWEKARPIHGFHEYLERQRKIPEQVLGDPVFADRIRTDHRCNALFAHHNPAGLCGFEIKNQGFTGFSPGGARGLFCSRPRPDDRELVICETAIDALSFAALFGTARKRFASTAGQISLAQKGMLQSAARKMAPGSMIVLATDNDPAGRQLAKTIVETLNEIDMADRPIVTRLPRDDGEDWNDVLRRSGNCKLAFLTLG